MYPLSFTGTIPGLRAPTPSPGPAPYVHYGDRYCSTCDVQWSNKEGPLCWSCGEDMRDPREEEEES